MMFTHGETVVVWRRPPRDRFGDLSFVEHHEIDGVAIEFDSQAEPNQSGAIGPNKPLARYDVTCYCGVGVDVLANDMLELPDGDKYHVVGRPERPRHPRTGNAPGVVVRLRRIEG